MTELARFHSGSAASALLDRQERRAVEQCADRSLAHISLRRVTAIAAGMCLLTMMTSPGVLRASTLRQVPYVQDGRVVGKLTQSYTWSELGRKLFGSLASVVSHSYRDPDTGDKVSIVVGVDARWSRIVWSTSYQGESRVSDFGGFGNGTIQMNSPSDLAIGANGNLYVADTGNGRVKVFMWLADYSASERYFIQLFIIPGGSDFRYPDQVLWDDNGTPNTAVDDILWVLDRMAATIVGYHILYANSQWSYSPYVRIPLKEMFQGTSIRYPLSFTKGRAYTSPSEASTYCTEDLIVFDAANDCFLRLNIPRTPGVITSPAAQVSLTTIPNPQPGVTYTRLTTDAWGNSLRSTVMIRSF